jgi:hypothetical protein
MRLQQTASFYSLAICLLCLGYLGLQIVGIPTIFLEVDEFWFAHHIFEYTQQLPYQDFPPYKTVLGYYLLSLPLYFAHGLFTPIYYIKDEIAIINTLMFALVAWWCVRIFQPRAIFYTLLILISSQMFLLFSSQTRVDMLASWLCLLSILFLVNQRTVSAGIFIALAFLTSQKAIWYVVGSNAALGICWLAEKEYKKDLRVWFTFNFSALMTLIVYVAFWSMIASFHEVMRSVFYEAYTQSKIDYYSSASLYYWRFILQHGPLLVMLLPLTALSLFAKSVSRQRLLLLTYGIISFLTIFPYTQFFPYNIVFLVPAFLMIYGEFFSWLLSAEMKTIDLSSHQLFWFFSVTLFFLVEFILIMHLPLIYFLVLLIPAVLWRQLVGKHDLSFNSKIAIGAVILITGVVVPLLSFGKLIYFLNGDYQRENIRIADTLLKNGGNYIAGSLVFQDKDRSIDGFKDLIEPAIAYAQTGDKTLLPILVASLKITPKTSAQMLDEVKNAPLKVIINNRRIAALPAPVLDYLRANYQHYWASVYLYAPTITAGDEYFQLKFAGNYTVEAAHDVVIDKQTIPAQSVISLAQGQHFSQTGFDYRLRLNPVNSAEKLVPRYQHDCPPCTRLSFNIQDYTKN